MSHQNLSSALGSSFEQPKNISSLSNSFEKLEITKSLDKKRDEYLKAIRSQKRKLRLHNKRLNALSIHSLSNQLDNVQIQEDTFGEGHNLIDYIDQCVTRTYTNEDYDDILRSLSSSNRFKQHFGAIGLRRLLSTAECPSIQEVLDTGVIPRLIEFMEKVDEQHLQLESAWVISNLVSGTTEQTKHVIDHGALPVLIRLLRSTKPEVKEKAAWALANIAGDNTGYRDLILRLGGLSPLIRMLDKAMNKGRTILISSGTWALSNLCAGKPLPEYEEIREAIPVLAKVVMTQDDPEVLSHALSPLCSMTWESCEQIQEMLETGIVPYLVRIIEKDSAKTEVLETGIASYLARIVEKDLEKPSVLTLSINLIGNLLLGTEEQTTMVLQVPGVTDVLFDLLKRPEESIRTDVAWIFSNIAAGTSAQLEYILSADEEKVDLIFNLCKNDSVRVRNFFED